MTENVILTVKGHQTDIGEDATTELITGAAYYYRNGKHYILYDEVDPESGEQSGNTIKISDDRVDVIRRGSGRTHMVFEERETDFFAVSYTGWCAPDGSIHIQTADEKR